MKYLFYTKLVFISVFICFLSFSCKSSSSNLHQTPSSKEDIKTEKEIEDFLKKEGTTSVICNDDTVSTTDELVKDNFTKRFWTSLKTDKKTWKDASAYCKNLKINNRSFILPTLYELATFLKNNCINATSSYLWSTTLHYNDPDWVFVFKKDKSNNYYYHTYPKQQTLPFLCMSEQYL